MAETPEDIYARAVGAADGERRLPLPPVSEWETFPFDGDLRVRPLQPPSLTEPPRQGEDASDCYRCRRGDTGAIWRNDDFRLVPLGERSGLPVVVLLEARDHLDFGELGDGPAAELGRLLVRVERAIRLVEGIGNVHVCRWGDGSFHMHVWFMARPARLPQLRGTFAAVWADILPPTPPDIWNENLETIARALAGG